jgi:hypothetical protein
MSISFGSDPELMLVGKDGIQSAIGVVQGSIENRIRIKGHEFYYDNVLAECAVKPGTSKKEVLNNFRECLQIYAEMVKPFKLAAIASYIFPDSQLTHPDARKVGCAPDNCAYELKQVDPPKEMISSGNLRSCGGHVHIGSELLKGDGAEPILVIYMLDLFVGVPSLYLDRDITSARRRMLYGQAGRYRVKPYGLEYRSLGNFWLTTPRLTSLVYDLCVFAHEFVESGKAWELWEFDIEVFFNTENLSNAWKCNAYDPALMRKVINNGNKEEALSLLELAKGLMPEGLRNDLVVAIDKPPDDDMYSAWKIN